MIYFHALIVDVDSKEDRVREQSADEGGAAADEGRAAADEGKAAADEGKAAAEEEKQDSKTGQVQKSVDRWKLKKSLLFNIYIYFFFLHFPKQLPELRFETR